MDRLIQCLMKKGILKQGGCLPCVTNDCSKQYQSAASLHFMSHLSIKYNIVVDRAINCAGHGKSIVDAINGINKNTILRLTRRKVSHASDAVDKDN